MHACHKHIVLVWKPVYTHFSFQAWQVSQLRTGCPIAPFKAPSGALTVLLQIVPGCMIEAEQVGAAVTGLLPCGSQMHSLMHAQAVDKRTSTGRHSNHALDCRILGGYP